MDLERIIERVRRLLAVSQDRGATANEAAIAAETARRMLDEHGLTLEQVESLAKSEGGGVVTEKDETRNRVEAWEQSLASKLGKGFDVRPIIFYQYYPRRSFMAFVGFAADVAVCKFLFSTLRREITKRARQSYKESGTSASLHTWVTSFGLGAASEIGRRLEELREPKRSQQAALIVAKEEAIERALPEDLGKPRSRAVTVYNQASLSGRKFGADACLDGRPLPQPTQSPVAGFLGQS